MVMGRSELKSKVSLALLVTMLMPGCYPLLKPMEANKLKSPLPVEEIVPVQSDRGYVLDWKGSREFERGSIEYHKYSWQELIEKLGTLDDVQDYLDDHIANVSGVPMRSFKRVHEDRIGDCDNKSIAAAALLSDDGYTPNILIMHDFSNLNEAGHAMFLYKSTMGYGALGMPRMPAIYPDVPSLLKTLNNNYGENYTHYMVVDLDETFPNGEWKGSDVSHLKRWIELEDLKKLE